MKTSPSSLKIRHIITLTKEGKLVPRPEFQRRLVWTSADKIRFIDTILSAYPFPEIYLANGAVNVDTGANLCAQPNAQTGLSSASKRPAATNTCEGPSTVGGGRVQDGLGKGGL